MNLAQLEISTSSWKCRSGGSVVGELQTMDGNGLLMSWKEERLINKR